MFHTMNDSFLNLKIRTLRLKEIGTCIPGSYGVPESHRLFTLYSNFSSFFRSPVGHLCSRFAILAVIVFPIGKGIFISQNTLLYF